MLKKSNYATGMDDGSRLVVGAAGCGIDVAGWFCGGHLVVSPFKRVLRRYKNPALRRVAGFVQYPLKVLVLLIALNF
jgi:hypothetical protein